MLAGGGYNDCAAVAMLTAGAAESIAWLQALGARFDGDERGFHFAREGGHRRARVLHAGGDASGRLLLRVLQEAVRRAGHIRCCEATDAEALLLRGDRVVGIDVRDIRGRCERVDGAAVVLATGGLGGLFAATSNPQSAQGSGLALGLAAGATARDLALVQFHPTALATGTGPGVSLPLLTEALRGAGAVLRDAQGGAIMAGEHPMADLAPRDVVARRMWRLQQAGHALFLDATGISADWPTQFPTVLAACLSAGHDARVRPVPVTPAAHFHMGGLATDLDGATSLAGLYAVGEVACNGVHGSNRLASNSLLEGVVFGRRLGQYLAGQARTDFPARPLRRRARAPNARPRDLARLRGWLWQGLGPVRDIHGLRIAGDRIRAATMLACSWQGKLSLALLDAALRETGNRGAHYRSDFATA